MAAIEYERLFNFTQIKVKEHFVVRKVIDINEHERLTLHLDTNQSKGT